MKNIKLGNMNSSQIAFGMWRSNEKTINNKKLKEILDKLIELKINIIDTADIYGEKEYGESEKVLGIFFKEYPQYKEKFKIVTKCGILFRDVQTKHYNNNEQYIIQQVDKSLKNMNCDKIDLFLLHRPNVFLKMEEVYNAFKKLKDSGKVIQFGVSNYSSVEFEALNKYLKKRDLELVTNQIELSVLNPEHLLNHNTAFLKGEEISPMIWSPLAGGEIFKHNEVSKALAKIAAKYNLTVSQLAIQYINNQGLNPVIILGTHKVERIEEIVKTLDVEISTEDMFAILKLTTNKDIL